MLANIFKNPQILNKETHKDLRLSPYKNYEFTKDAYLVPISLGEMLVAAKSLIIVFVKDKNQEIYPSVVLGGEGGENLLLQKDLTWKANAYIPAVLRCYPFGLGSNEDTTYITLDADADVFKDEDAKLIIKDKDNLTQEGQHAVDFISEVYQNINSSKEFASFIEKLGILKRAEITIEHNGEKLEVKNGIYIVDENSLNKLESRKLKKLATNGSMKLIYAHLLSLNNRY